MIQALWSNNSQANTFLWSSWYVSGAFVSWRSGAIDVCPPKKESIQWQAYKTCKWPQFNKKTFFRPFCCNDWSHSFEFYWYKNHKFKNRSEFRIQNQYKKTLISNYKIVSFFWAQSFILSIVLLGYVMWLFGCFVTIFFFFSEMDNHQALLAFLSLPPYFLSLLFWCFLMFVSVFIWK